MLGSGRPLLGADISPIVETEQITMASATAASLSQGSHAASPAPAQWPRPRSMMARPARVQRPPLRENVSVGRPASSLAFVVRRVLGIAFALAIGERQGVDSLVLARAAVVLVLLVLWVTKRRAGERPPPLTNCLGDGPDLGQQAVDRGNRMS